MSEGELAEYIATSLGPYEWDEYGIGEDDIGVCLNCYSALTPSQGRKGKVYCSEKCNQIAGTVRYGRKALKDGRWNNPDVQEAIKMRIGHILAGGYPEEARRVPPEMRAFIFARDKHTCVLCGAPADTIDHINGSANTPDNLRALCRSCNMGRVKFVPASPSEAEEARAILSRMMAESPLQLCDDEEAWDNGVWREIAARNREWGRWWS